MVLMIQSLVVVAKLAEDHEQGAYDGRDELERKWTVSVYVVQRIERRRRSGRVRLTLRKSNQESWEPLKMEKEVSGRGW